MLRLNEVQGRDRSLCIFYAVFALFGALSMTSMAVTFVIQNLDAGPFGIIWNFLRDALTNLAARFIYADLVLIWAVLGIFMIVEGRRLGIRHLWAYIVGAPALALAVSFPVFMYVRQLRIAALREESTGQHAAGQAGQESTGRDLTESEATAATSDITRGTLR